jgi:1-acyl-sn-glycerol-3-phosphate acyltransferase
MIFIALIGYGATRALPKVAMGAPQLNFDLNLWRQAQQGTQFACTDHLTWISILGISWSWAIGSIYLTQLPMYSRYALKGEAVVASILVSCFIFGLLSGAFFFTRTQFSRTEPGLIPVGLIGLMISGLAFAQFSIPVDYLQSAGQVFTQATGLGAGTSVFLIGMFGGLFVVPQYALLQQRTALNSRARVVATNNLLNALFMIVTSLSSIIFLGIFQWSLKLYLTLCALICLPILLIQMKELSHDYWRLVGYLLARTAYRVKILNKGNIPENGPVLLVCNHISYADAVVLFGSIDRRTRFVMEDIYHRIPVLNWAFRGARTIPISSLLKSRKKFEEGENSAVDAIRNGEMVFIFPEGRLSPAGEIIPFKRGVMRILEQQPVTVVPVAIRGLWGSYFSHGGGKPALKGFPKLSLRRRLVTVKFGDPLEASKAALESMQQQVAQLHAQI